MGERTSHPHGTFSWIDLATDDVGASKAFYGGLFGWEFEDLPMGDRGHYSMARIDGKDVAALYPSDGSQGPPHWNCYITVDDVDAIAPRVAEAGGKLAMEPFDVFESGRMAFLEDPTGAFVALWQPRQSIGAQLVNVPGALTWNDLNTHDPQEAQRFYRELLGWEYEETEGFPYWVIRNGGRTNGGMRQFGPEEQNMAAHWLPYFAVEDVGATGAKLEELGGHGVAGPMEVPNGGQFAVGQDPQGAFFAFFAGDFDA